MQIFTKKYIQTLFYFSLFCFAFLLVRNYFEQNTQYNFLTWNLFLGFIPFVIALILQKFSKGLQKFWLLAGTCLWLLFYPNAPYMITDFIHVQASSTDVIYDALLIFSFSMLSLFFGFYSLKLVQKVISERTTKFITNAVIAASLLLSSFGIYLGRILRLNSWDVFTNFIETFKLIFDHLIPVSKNPVTYLIIILFTAIQWFLLNLMQNIDNE